MRNFAIFAVTMILLLLAIAAIFILFSYIEELESEGQIEIIISLIQQIVQFMLLGVLGVLVKWVIDESRQAIERRTEDKERQNREHQEVSEKLREQLREVRLAHRVVRTAPLDLESKKDVIDYKLSLKALLDARQKYIDIGDDVRHSDLRHHIDLEFHNHLSRVINFLSDILLEGYQRDVQSWEEVISLRHYGELRTGALNFRNSSASEDYKKRYDDHYEAIKSLLHRALNSESIRRTIKSYTT